MEMLHKKTAFVYAIGLEERDTDTMATNQD